MGAYIKAISYYLPEKYLTNEDLAREFGDWSAEKIAKKIGVETRHVVAGDETAGDLAFKAAEKLIEENNLDRSAIDFILLCTQSPDYRLPTTACIIQARLGLPTTVGALDFNLGCSGCVYGMALAKGLVSAGIAKNILLITAETYSKYLHPEDKSNRTIFGDGAAACLISSEGMAEIGNFVLGTDGNGAENLIIKTGGARRYENSGVSVIDDEGHIRHDDFLYMNGGAIFNFTLDTIPTLLSQILEKNDVAHENIDYHVFHQANKYMLEILRKVCGIPKNKFYLDMADTGNTVSATILIGLKKAIDAGLISKGNNVVIAGFGVGLSWGGTLLKF